MDLNLSGILDQTSSAVSGFDQAAGKITDISNQVSDLTQQKVQTDNDAATAAATVKGIDLTNQAQQEATRKAIAARLGTDATLGAGWIVGKAADDMKQFKANADIASANIQSKESINPLQNPLGWILGKATVGSDYANYNYWARQYNSSEQQALDAEKMTQESFVTNNALSSTTSQAYINAAKVVAGYQYNADSINSQLQGARWNLDAVVNASNMTRDKLSALYQGNNAIMQQKQFGLEQQRTQLALQEFNLRKQAFTEKTDEDSLVQRYIQRGYFNLTGQQMDPGRAKDAIILFKSKQPQVMQYFQNGLESNQNGGQPLISTSPFDASTLVGTKVAQNLSPSQQLVGNQLVTWRREFGSNTYQATLEIDKKDRNAVASAFNSFVSDKLAQETANVQPGSIFAPASIKQVASTNTDVQSSPVWNNVLKPASDAGVDIDNPNTTFSLVTAAVNSGKLSYRDALDLSTVYRAGLELNNSAKNFTGMGLPPIRSYNTQVSVPGTIGKTTIDLANDQAIATALNRMAARHLTNRAMAGVGAGAPFTTSDSQ